MVLLDKCCFIISLRTGCIILTYMYMIGTLTSTFLILFDTFLGVNVLTNELVEIQVGTKELILNGILVIFMFSAFLFSFVQLIGLHKNVPEYVKIYIAYTMIYLVIYAVLFVIKTANEIGNVIEGLVYIAFGAYYFVITGSYYIKMREYKPAYMFKI